HMAIRAERNQRRLDWLARCPPPGLRTEVVILKDGALVKIERATLKLNLAIDDDLAENRPAHGFSLSVGELECGTCPSSRGSTGFRSDRPSPGDRIRPPGIRRRSPSCR